MKSNKTGCPPEREYDLENCVIGAEKAAWFAFIAIGWQRDPLAQASAAMNGLTHEVLGNHRRQSQQTWLELGLCLNDPWSI